MKNLRTNIYTAATLIIVMIASLSSCTKDLCYNHFRSLKVHLEYEQVWERDYGINTADIWDSELIGLDYTDLIPEESSTITVQIYNIEGGDSAIRTDFINEAKDHDLAIGEGINSVLFFTSGTEAVESKGMSDRKSAYCSASRASRSSYSRMYDDEITVLEPDMVYTAYLSDIPEIAMHEQRGLIVKMQPLVFTYLFIFEFEKGIDNVALARGAISGMAIGAYYRSADTLDETATILFENCKIVDNRVIAIVRSFGPPGFVDTYYEGPTPSRASRAKLKRSRSDDGSDVIDNGDTGSQRLNLELRLTSGSFKEMYFDVSQLINANPTGGIVHLTGLKVEDSENVGSSLFDVNIEGWGEAEDIPLPITPSR